MDKILYDFNTPDETACWYPINDTIMGGCSQSQLLWSSPSSAIFTGNVSAENNDGFASIRSQPSNFNLSAFAGLSLKVVGDGKQYKLNLRTEATFDGINYQATFQTADSKTETIWLTWIAFVPTFRGRTVYGYLDM